MLESKFKKLGLSDKETAVFLALFEHKKLSAPRIANVTGIKRPTVYAVAKDLQEAGFIESDTSGATTYFFARDPDDLVNITKKEKRAVMDKELVLEELAQDLRELPHSATYAVPKIKFIEHQENVVEYLYARTDTWLQSMQEDKTLWGFQDHSLVEESAYREWIAWQWKRTPKDIGVKVLTNDSDVERNVMSDVDERRQVKFWKKSFDFTSTQWIFGEYSLMIVTNQKPHYLVETHDAVYARNMRVLFRSLWEDIS